MAENEEPNCPLMTLPTELRLQIYSACLLDSPAITISSAEVVGAHPDIVHRLYGDSRTPYQGLPRNHEPVIADRYDARLLSITNPARIPANATKSVLDDGSPYARDYRDCPSLLLVNRQIHSELKSHFNLTTTRRTSLFLSFPHGLHVFRTLAPSMIRQTRSLHIAGTYTPTTFSPTHRAWLPNQGPHHPSLESRYNNKVLPDSSTQLADLIKSAFGPPSPRRRHIAKLELRIYYPGEDSYSVVWGDDCSPIVLALRNIYAGDIGIVVYRGRYGTGVYLSAKPSWPVEKASSSVAKCKAGGSGTADEREDEGERRRVVSTVWRRLEEGRRNEPVCGSWAVDPKWPEWENEEEATEGKGDTVITGTARDGE